MKSTNEIIQFLKQILDERTSEKEKAELIKDFQNEVWYDESPDESTFNPYYALEKTQGKSNVLE